MEYSRFTSIVYYYRSTVFRVRKYAKRSVLERARGYRGGSERTVLPGSLRRKRYSRRSRILFGILAYCN